VVCLAAPQESAAGGLRDVRAVKVRTGQGFVMDTGAWHAIPFPAGSTPARFLVIFRSGTGRDDLQFCDFAVSPVVTG
jgi:ureidoglycolate hydrolase